MSDLPTIPGYTILEELGRGAMGVVYHARDENLDREVAIKLLKLAFPSTAEAERFQTEAKATARLHHQSIVEVYDTGEVGDLSFLVMELVPGKSLEEWLNSKAPVTPTKAAQMMATLAAAMQHAHQNFVVHRDLKPSNIIVLANGQLKITDFGLAKEIDSDKTAQTFAGTILGTPGYMSPEQAQGNSDKVLPAADIYSLGAIFYELLTGQRPFHGQTITETLLSVTNADPIAPNKVSAQFIPRDLETICLKCLAKKPANRYATADALAKDLQRFLDNRPILARPVSLVERFGMWVKRQPALAGSLAASLMILLTAFCLISWQWHQTAEALAQAEQSLYYQQIAHAEREWQSNNVGEANRILDTCSPKLHHYEWFYLKRKCSAGETVFDAGGLVKDVGWSTNDQHVICATQNPQAIVAWNFDRQEKTLVIAPNQIEAIRAMAIGNDGAHMTTASSRGEVLLWNTKTGKVTQRLANPAPAGDLNLTVHSLSFAAKSNAVAWGTLNGTLYIWQAGATPDLTAIQAHESEIVALALSPDGQFVASASNTAIAIWNTATGYQVADLHGHQDRVVSLAWHPNQELLASASLDGTVRLWNVSDQSQLTTTWRHTAAVHAVSFSPDGMHLASAGADRGIKVWAVKAPYELLGILRGHTKAVRTLAFSANGTRLASAGEDHAIRLWQTSFDDASSVWHQSAQGIADLAFVNAGNDVAIASNDANVQLRSTLTKATQVLPGPKKTTIASLDNSDRKLYLAVGYQNGTTHIWHTATGELLGVLFDNERALANVAISPDGNYVATGGFDKFVRVWKLSRTSNGLSGTVVQTLRGHALAVRDVVFSHDGNSIATSSDDQTVRVWSTSTGELKTKLLGHKKSVMCLDWHPNKDQLASGSADGTVRLWNTKTGELKKTLTGHSTEVVEIAYSQDGQRLATASHDGLIQVWNQAGRNLVSLDSLPAALSCLEFTPDGKHLVTGDSAGTIRWR